MATHVDIYRRNFSITKLAPEGATPVTVQSNAAAWTYGASSNDILVTTTRITILGIWAYLNNNATYNIRIVDTAGSPNVYCTEIFHRVAATDHGKHVGLVSPIIPAGTTLKAQCQDSVGNNTCLVAINYIEL